MPVLSAHQSSRTTKMLFLGDSGAGKTGGLASLASAGYNLRILDMDNGLDVLFNLLTDAKSKYGKDAASRVNYVTINEPRRIVGGKLVPKKAEAWQRAVGLLANWEDGETKLGPIESWTQQEVLVIDSFSALSEAALNFVCAMNGRLGARPYESDWGEGQRLIRDLLELLTSPLVKCNVIMNCHVKFIGEEGGPLRGFPNTLGKALPPDVGRYFNNAIMARSAGQGNAIRRKILTNTTGVVELKNSAPMRVEAEYPLETGLADYFKAVRGQVAAVEGK